MISEAELRREADRVSSYVSKYIRVAGTEKQQEVLEMFDNMHLLFPYWVIGTCPMMHPDIHFVSSNCQHILGYSKEFLLQNSRPEKYFNLVNETDRSDLFSCIEFMREEMEAIPPEEHHEYRCMVHYRFKKGDGNYIFLADEKASLKLKDGSLLYYILLRDVTSERPFSGVKAELFHHQNGIRKLKED